MAKIESRRQELRRPAQLSSVSPYVRPTRAEQAEPARAGTPRSRWLDLSQLRVVQALGVLQACVIAGTTVALVALTSTNWVLAVVAGLGLSLAINLALSRFSLAAVRRHAADRGATLKRAGS